MELTRRDAVLALVGLSTGGSLLLHEIQRKRPQVDTTLSDEDVAVLTSLAQVVYPSSIRVSAGFIRAYTARLSDVRLAAMIATIEQLDVASRRRLGVPFQQASLAQRSALLDDLGVDRAISMPDGTVDARIRHHLVNSLLYALYSTPKGSRLFGIDNPKGYPGGLAYGDPARTVSSD